MKKTKSKNLIGILLAMALFMAGCSYANTDPAQFACAYGGGPFESKVQKGDNPIPPSSGRDFIGVADTIVYLPADVRNYIVDGTPGVGDIPTGGVIKTPTGDGVQVAVELSLRFRYNTELGCEFWDEHGKRFDVNTTEGWSEFLAENFLPILENGAKGEITEFREWETLWRNEEIDGERAWTTLQDSLGQIMVDEISNSLGGNFFCGVSWKPGSDACPPFEILIKSIVPADSSLMDRYSNIAAEQAETQRQREVKARELEAVELDAATDLAEAQAQLEVSRVEAEKAIIDAQAAAAECEALIDIGVDCSLYEAARNGSIDFWVVDGENAPVITTQAG